MQKARRRHEWLRPLVDTQFQDLFHSLVQGSFHLSFTVLVRYRSLRSIQPYRMVPANSDRISHVPPYSGYYQVYKLFRVRAFHPLRTAFPNHSTIIYKSISQSYNPLVAETTKVWAVSSSLATTTEITFVFLISSWSSIFIASFSSSNIIKNLSFSISCNSFSVAIVSFYFAIKDLSLASFYAQIFCSISSFKLC